MTTQLRVLSYNIHKGYSAANRGFVLDQMRAAIRQTGATIVMLQEVRGLDLKTDAELNPAAVDSQFEFLADTIWNHHAYGKNSTTTEGHHGNAILSELPILSAENINISAHALDRRGLLHATVDLSNSSPHPALHVLCSHLGLFEFARRAQLEKITERVVHAIPKDAPLLLAGDFNDWRVRLSDPLEQRLSLREVFADLYGQHATTFPSWLPFLRLDRIYYRGLKLKQARVLNDETWRKLSDHCPLFAEFETLN